MSAMFPQARPRRMRRTPTLRTMMSENSINVQNLIMPLFIKHGDNIKNPIASMPGQYQISLDKLSEEVKEIEALGLKSVLVFGIPEHKDLHGSDAFNANGIVPKAIQLIKEVAPSLQVISDICCCEYTSHGHCGVIDDVGGHKDVHNDKTLALLAQQAQTHAKAGVDLVAPSGMIDGMVTAIRHALDDIGYNHLPIMSYSVKYASNLYGPFREAAEGAPSFGDRKTYQMDPANSFEAFKEVDADIQEGADILMVKPAGMYLDVIEKLKSRYPQYPMAAYQVSGEYAMIKAAGQNGWMDEQKVMLESLLAIKRAGADMIISYFAKDVARLLQS